MEYGDIQHICPCPVGSVRKYTLAGSREVSPELNRENSLLVVVLLVFGQAVPVP